ncbi:MAG: metalloprotease, partial [Flavobacteriaceae bacterium]
MNFKHFFLYFTFALPLLGLGQHVNKISASLNSETKEIKIQQEFTYKNQSADTLSVLYFNDWSNAYAHKDSPLASRFADDFKKNLHLASKELRGGTDLIGAVDQNYYSLPWWRNKEKDIIGISLNKPIAPGDFETITFTYTVKLPPNKYTSFGYDTEGGYFLKDWYLTPAVYKNKAWLLYSNKDLQDLYTDITSTEIKINYAKELVLNSNYKETLDQVKGNKRWATLTAQNKKGAEMYLTNQNSFVRYPLSSTTLVTDLRGGNLDTGLELLAVMKVFSFIEDKIGAIPLDQLLVTKMNYDRNPLYGLNKLPSFVNPYEESFKLELSLLKTGLYT